MKAHLRFLPPSTHWDTGTLLWGLGKELQCDKGPPQGPVFAVMQLSGKELQRDEGSPHGLVFATQYPLGHYDGRKVGNAA